MPILELALLWFLLYLIATFITPFDATSDPMLYKLMSASHRPTTKLHELFAQSCPNLRTEVMIGAAEVRATKLRLDDCSALLTRLLENLFINLTSYSKLDFGDGLKWWAFPRKM